MKSRLQIIHYSKISRNSEIATSVIARKTGQSVGFPTRDRNT